MCHLITLANAKTLEICLMCNALNSKEEQINAPTNYRYRNKHIKEHIILNVLII
ncbi:hypothetical protein PPRY_b1094 [Pseudoalteromonas prydzensis ACAM 620]|nr:hypothetical protein [Pseudoalteromonas prydzensis ACAM 620]